MKWMNLYFMEFASSAGVTGGSDGAPPPSGGEGAGSPSPGGGGGAPGVTAPSGQPSGGQPQGGGNIAQLRTEYEALKAKYEPWSKFEADEIDHESVTTAYSTFQRIYTEAAELGRNLGYDDDEIAEALQQEPIAVLRYLQSESAKAAQGGGGQQTEEERIQELINQAVEARTAPLMSAENVRQTNAANNRFEQYTMGLISEHLKKDGFTGNAADSPETDTLMRITSELMKYDTGALSALKHEGKTALINKYFAEAVKMADTYYAARYARETTPAPGASGKPWEKGKARAAAAGAKKPTLDDMIDNPETINPKYKPGT
jgi:hypothetical protein